LTPDAPEPLEEMPLIVVVVDELADLMMVTGKKIEELISASRKARAAGIHLILATQRPPSTRSPASSRRTSRRIAFQVVSKVDSRTILDQMGAEALLGQGDMLYLPPGNGSAARDWRVRLRRRGTASSSIWRRRAAASRACSRAARPTATRTACARRRRRRGRKIQAVQIVLKTRRLSISLVQRHLRIGCGQPRGALIEQMERAGLVSPCRRTATGRCWCPPRRNEVGVGSRWRCSRRRHFRTVEVYREGDRYCPRNQPPTAPRIDGRGRADRVGARPRRFLRAVFVDRRMRLGNRTSTFVAHLRAPIPPDSNVHDWSALTHSYVILDPGQLHRHLVPSRARADEGRAAACLLAASAVAQAGGSTSCTFLDGAKNGRATFKQTVVASDRRSANSRFGTFAFQRPANSAGATTSHTTARRRRRREGLSTTSTWNQVIACGARGARRDALRRCSPATTRSSATSRSSTVATPTASRVDDACWPPSRCHQGALAQGTLPRDGAIDRQSTARVRRLQKTNLGADLFRFTLPPGADVVHAERPE
jgi:hypothetical protein